ncbi:MAG TPA: 2Fe-2S iron-sulfur cluster binding domain-containing protein [Methylothermaceae bacterium]|nr:2Fe-2S iron-sulfur cluster binding domain-containing protein [Methylothermaceae bacterium]
MSSLSLDGREIAFEPGQTIIQAALAAGIYIPHLCWHPDFPPHGSCKLCTVKVNGRLCSACTFPAVEGQEVIVHSEELRQLRLRLTQMLFVEGNHFCPSCEKSGQCELQAMGYYVGMTDSHYPHFFPVREIDASHPHVLLDRDRCIFCELCVRASRAEGKNVFELAGRGIHTRLVVNSPTGKLGDSDLEVNDRAAHICPVGAIIVKETAFRVPIGRRKYDHRTIAEVSLGEEAPLVRKRHD